MRGHSEAFTTQKNTHLQAQTGPACTLVRANVTQTDGKGSKIPSE